ncbi:type II and III secretion system protein [Hydrogenophaga sp. NFH-34]|uniref:type II and III secretion system protein n=1 Tax=Hydrogenophaga sp. NFH-34 TaxID=2744446 RepID=UPI001F20A8ED|nr:type II and III secretion system protein [Hydrogenophaga sp. NFH-34]
MRSNTNKIIFAFSAIASAVVLSGCSSPGMTRQQQEIKNMVPTGAITQSLHATSETYGAPDHVAQRGTEFRSQNVVRRVSAPWVGGLRTVAKTEDRLPAVFNARYTFDFAGRTSINTVAERLSMMTGVPVRVRADVFASPGAPESAQEGDPVKPAFPTPIAGASLDAAVPNLGITAKSPQILADAKLTTVRSVDMRFEGRLRDFLDSMTAKMGLSWEFRDGAVAIVRLLTESYDVGAFPGSQNYTFNTGGGSGGTSSEDGVRMSASNRLAIAQSGETDVRESILKTVQEIVATDIGASVTWADGSGRLVVVASKETQARVRDFLNKEHKALTQMVNVTFDVYSVLVSENDEKGVDWSSVFQSLNQRYGITFKSPSFTSTSTAGSLTTNYISAGATTNTSSILTLLNSYGNTAKIRPVSINTLNGQWDTKSRLSTDGYLKETTPGTASSSGAAGAPGLKTDTITTGDQYAALPYIQSDKSILLKYSISLSDLLGLFEVSTGAGETFQKVQTPRVDSINASSTIRLAPGETAVITGLSRLVASKNENRLSREVPVIAGGNLKSSIQREHFMVLVRATPL